MAHFAELDKNNIVKRVVVVANDIETEAGPLGNNDKHVDGEAWCARFFKGGVWKQTSYTHNFRKQFCGANFTYDPVQDIFIQPQPYESFTLDSNSDWQPPVAVPTITTYDTEKIYSISWDEPNLRWGAKDKETPVNNFIWDASALSWVSE